MRCALSRSVAGWTGTSPSASSGGTRGPEAKSSYSETRNPRLSREPVSRSRVPGDSFCATQGWLNHVARTEPDSSPTLTERIERPRRRKALGLAPSTSTWIVALAPISMAATGTTVRSR